MPPKPMLLQAGGQLIARLVYCLNPGFDISPLSLQKHLSATAAACEEKLLQIRLLKSVKFTREKGKQTRFCFTAYLHCGCPRESAKSSASMVDAAVALARKVVKHAGSSECMCKAMAHQSLKSLRVAVALWNCF